MKKFICTIMLLTIAAIIFDSCKKKKDDEPVLSADEELFNESTASGYTYLYGNSAIIAGLGGSPHGFEKIKFNATAQTALDGSGKLPVGSSFPTGSIIVKEVFTSASGTLKEYAVMKKDAANVNAASGWVWAEYNTDGSVKTSVADKGSQCVSCHSQTNNRDLTLAFDLH